MRNCMIWDTIWTQIGRNSNFSGADGGVELQPHIHLCLDNTHTGSGCVPQSRHGMSAYFPSTSKGGWWERMNGDMLLLSFPGTGRSGHLSSIRISWFIAGIAEQQITLRLPFYQRRTYACLFSNSVAPRLNSGMMPRCANWDKGLKLTMIYLIFIFQVIILNAVAQILLALLMYTAVS